MTIFVPDWLVLFLVAMSAAGLAFNVLALCAARKVPPPPAFGMPDDKPWELNR